ncbi:hypothetical protein RJD24_03570 [Bacillaceae bacterium IKA-2]|nr:hypothetical protein RJD24_03570 [Bacillaceae bacterium IKA-2]
MHHQQNTFEICKNHLHRYVLVQTVDQQSYDGIVENVDETNLYLAVPEGEALERDHSNEERLLGGVGFGPGLGYGGGFGYPGIGPPGYGYPGYGYPYYPRPRRRFRRLVLPLAALTALTLLPYY